MKDIIEHYHSCPEQPMTTWTPKQKQEALELAIAELMRRYDDNFRYDDSLVEGCSTANYEQAIAILTEMRDEKEG